MSTGSITQQMIAGFRRALLPLGQGVSSQEINCGDLVSIDPQGCIVPFTADLPFAGIADVLGEEKGVRKVSTLLHGTIAVPISGLSPETMLNSHIFARRQEQDTTFNLEGLGAPIGKLVGIEVIGIVRINVGGDHTGKDTNT